MTPLRNAIVLASDEVIFRWVHPVDIWTVGCFDERLDPVWAGSSPRALRPPVTLTGSHMCVLTTRATAACTPPICPSSSGVTARVVPAVIGSRLRAAREAAGLSVQQFAAAMQKSGTSNYEHGVRRISIESAGALVSVFGKGGSRAATARGERDREGPMRRLYMRREQGAITQVQPQRQAPARRPGPPEGGTVPIAYFVIGAPGLATLP